ncbi:MAG TPA: polysaccharide deacetylase family protein [Solirubrobacteraceae bacterium]|jgi:peptidoglycan/xylan/chitin deacetylase (PgdA/CDA1 family)|nr:polysaccharide deacetylase family protein [Solirubrobacteraceae bacterium]
MDGLAGRMVAPVRVVVAAVTVFTIAGGGLSWALGAEGPTDSVGHTVVMWVGKVRQPAVVRVLTRQRVVALTFDDGPDARYTPRVLSILHRFGARATFFVVGRNARAASRLVADELRAGHEVANHTYDHALLPSLSTREARLQIDRGRQELMAAGAPEPLMFRPPFGQFSAAAAEAAGRWGEISVAWTVTLERAINGRTVRHGVRWLLARLPRGGIILAHDGRTNRARTLLALPLLLDALRSKGYRVVPVGQLLTQVGDLNRRHWRALRARANPRLPT